MDALDIKATIDHGNGQQIDVGTSLKALLQDLEATGRWVHRDALAYALWVLERTQQPTEWQVSIDGERHQVTGWNYTLREINAE